MAAGTLGAIVILTHWYYFILDHDAAERFDRRQAKTAWFSLALYIAIFISGFLNPVPGLYLIASISTWLLFSGAGEAWLLLSLRVDSQETERKLFTQEFAAWVAPVINKFSARISTIRNRG